MKKFQIQSLKDIHLKNFLEDEYEVKIIKKYGVYLVIKDDILKDFFYTLGEVRSFLENKAYSRKEKEEKEATQTMEILNEETQHEEKEDE